MGFRHVAGPEGNELIPDLAEAEPQVSADGKTYTFKIRPGVKFSPPVDREVTAQDVLYAFKRIGTPSLVAQYGYYYNVVEGMAEFTEKGGLSAKGKNEISGISVPDDRTIVFKLTEPTGDFLFRVGMPATGPIPEEVAGCFTKAGEYGRFLISSGPYMMEGSDNLNAASCKELKPLAGFNPNQHLRLVRNPNYDEATDTKEARENFFDRFEMTLNTNAQDIFDRVKSGQLDFAYSTEPPEVIRDYTQNEDLKRNYHTDPGDRTWYITMNLTQPPFDDIHVRKAMNWVMDKEGLRRAWGGSVKGEIAQHIVPDTMFNNHLEDYAPYATEGDAGDVEKAMEEMKQSKYDTDQDGLCDAPQCKGVLHVTRTTDVFKGMVPVIEARPGRSGSSSRRASSRTPTGDPDDQASNPDQLDPGLGQGLRRRVNLHGAVRQPEHPGRGERELLAPRAHEGAGGRGRGRGHDRRHPERGRRHRPLQRALGRGAPHLLGGPRQEAHGGDRPLGALPGRERRLDHGRLDHAVRLRPVVHDARLVAHRGRRVAHNPTARTRGRPVARAASLMDQEDPSHEAKDGTRGGRPSLRTRKG